MRMNLPPYVRCRLLATFALTFTACDPCENHVLQEELAANGERKAVVFQRQCGVFGGTSIQVSLLQPAAQPFAGGNIFGADTNADQALETPDGALPIAVKWIGERELEIAHDARVRVFQSEKMLGDVTISYNVQTAPEPAPASPSKRNKK